MPARPSLLLGAGGAPSEELFEQLRQQRDMRPIYLAE
jgi:hypothetical protein